MLTRTQHRLIAAVAVAVLAMLWFVGNEKTHVPAQAPMSASDVQAASAVRGMPRNGTLDPISIDPARPGDALPQYQADAILDDYRDNAGAADDRYLGKYFIVEGVASGIRREGDAVYLDIRTQDPAVSVRAALLRRQICGPAGRVCEVEARATMVRRGQKVAVECNGAGWAEGVPRLGDCLLRGGAN
jgi:hypothetical protein